MYVEEEHRPTGHFHPMSAADGGEGNDYLYKHRALYSNTEIGATGIDDNFSEKNVPTGEQHKERIRTININLALNNTFT